MDQAAEDAFHRGQRDMRKLIMFLILTSAAAFGPSEGTSKPVGSPDVERTIRTLNLEWLRAYDIGDVAALDRIENDELVIAGDFGEIDKPKHLETVRKRGESQAGVNRIIEQQRIRSYNNVALVTEVDRYPDGNYSFQSTGLWVKRAESWKPVHLHYTLLKTKH